MNYSPNDKDAAKAEAIRIAREILADRVLVVEGCRRIQRPLEVLGLRMDKDFTIFIGVDSEADEFAFGEERKHWNPEALRKLDEKLVSFIQHWSPYVKKACGKVILRLEQAFP